MQYVQFLSQTVCSTADVPAWWCWGLLCTNIASASEILWSSANGSDSCDSTLACSATSSPKRPGRCFRVPKHAGSFPNCPACSRGPTGHHAECTLSKTHYRYKKIKYSYKCLLLSLLKILTAVYKLKNFMTRVASQSVAERGMCSTELHG
jgi:hypothetical protein